MAAMGSGSAFHCRGYTDLPLPLLRCPWQDRSRTGREASVKISPLVQIAKFLRRSDVTYYQVSASDKTLPDCRSGGCRFDVVALRRQSAPVVGKAASADPIP
jgi:hypothetical protein